jgi:hypothetical protein
MHLKISTAPTTSEPTLLFVLTPQDFYKIILPSSRNNSETENPSPVTLTQVLKLKNLITMEVNFANHTVCVMEDFDIFCYNVSNFMDKWKLPKPDFLPLFECELQLLILHYIFHE